MVTIPSTVDNELRVFNTAKKYAEEILFPKMNDFQNCQKSFDFGCSDIDKSVEYIPEMRDINRFNGLKGMADINYELLVNISSTVRLKNNGIEIKKLNELIETISMVQSLFREPSKFFISKFDDGKMVDTLNFDYCKKVKMIINVCYINTEMLMTQNGLLFRNVKDEFQEDSEILRQIKEEYVNN